MPTKRPAAPTQRLQLARERFRELLRLNADESEWQAFFAEHPSALSRSLPLRLSPSDIVPLGRPGQSEADFIFYQRSDALITGYGVIELKRPDARILTSPRKDLIILTREADTAIKQASQYARVIRLPQRALFLGASQHLFVIMGLSAHLTKAVGTDLLRDQMSGLLPTGCQILPYDELLRRFESTIPGRLLLLVPLMPSSSNSAPPHTVREPENLSSILDSVKGSSTHIEQLSRYATMRARQLALRFSAKNVDIEGVSQEALLRFLQTSAPIRDERAWLDKVILKEVYRATQSASQELPHYTRKGVTVNSDGREFIDLTPIADFERAQKVDDFRDAIKRLPLNLRAVIVLALEGSGVRDIARQLGITVRVTEQRYHEAVSHLSKLLRGDG